MTVLIGSDVTSYQIGEGFSAGEIFAWRFACTTAGTLTSLELFTNSVAASATSLVLGVYADLAGEPGVALGEGTHAGTPASEAWVAAMLTASVPLTLGVAYWLGFLPLGGGFGANLGVEDGTDRHLATAGNTHMATGAWEGPHTTNIGFRGVGTVPEPEQPTPEPSQTPRFPVLGPLAGRLSRGRGGLAGGLRGRLAY